MRRRWQVRWGFLEDEPWPARFVVLCFCWSMAGLVALTVAGVASTIVTGSDLMNPALYIVLAAGVGLPFAVALAVSLVAGAVWIVRHPPIRRVTESSPDIRDAYRQ